MQKTQFPKKLLMIHDFKNEYLDFDLDNYIITFDDGLYSQYQGCLDLIKKFPNIRIIIFISTGIIHSGSNTQTNNKSGVAHNLFFKHELTDNFLTLEQISELSQISNITIGIHGHKHLNIEKLFNQYSLIEVITKWKSDYLEMFQTVEKWKQLNILKDNIYYCTPYNQYHKLLHPLMLKQYKHKFNKDLILIGPGRTTIEEITKGIYCEQYY